ncbi:hypothetical protein [Maribacter ulvicola]|uniref:hypothetical protein n=1 Tax=Maribacter ulvicola TaxID=228959 RepID=UPI000970A5B8|nr:hypothetical protein [Maribacter ulvicola]
MEYDFYTFIFDELKVRLPPVTTYDLHAGVSVLYTIAITVAISVIVGFTLKGVVKNEKRICWKVRQFFN